MDLECGGFVQGLEDRMLRYEAMRFCGETEGVWAEEKQ